MLKALLTKLKESIISIIPITMLVLILSFTPFVSLNITETIVFIVSAIMLILGMTLFNMGADMSMTPMGELTGKGLAKTKKIWLLLLVSFLMGLLITIAEPDLSVLAEQVKSIVKSKTLLILTVGIGVGIFLLFAMLKIIFKKDLSLMIVFFYMALFMISTLLIYNGKWSLVSLSFDSGGVTTGPITVPFIMAFGVGAATVIGGKNSSENSFGLIALCSVGPILAVMVLMLTSNGSIEYALDDYSVNIGFKYIFKVIGSTALDTLKALALISIIFFLLNIIIFKIPFKKLVNVIVGLLFTYVGLVIFLSAVTIGFMPIGFKLGEELSKNKVLVTIFAFVIGCVTVLAEPAVHVLNKQVEDITDGIVTKKSMLIALSIGVGLSLGLSILRIIFDFSILYYLIPGYFISLGLSFFVPKLYTAIAFDSGGVASGPLTSSFVLPLAIGVCASLYPATPDRVLDLAFGVVAMVAMAPLITIQVLGFRAIIDKKIRNSISMKRILTSDDEEIIYFNTSKRGGKR